MSSSASIILWNSIWTAVSLSTSVCKGARWRECSVCPSACGCLGGGPVRDSVMGQAGFDEHPTGINSRKTEGSDECVSGAGKSRSKGSEPHKNQR